MSPLFGVLDITMYNRENWDKWSALSTRASLNAEVSRKSAETREKGITSGERGWRVWRDESFVRSEYSFLSMGHLGI